MVHRYYYKVPNTEEVREKLFGGLKTLGFEFPQQENNHFNSEGFFKIPEDSGETFVNVYLECAEGRDTSIFRRVYVQTSVSPSPDRSPRFSQGLKKLLDDFGAEPMKNL